MINLENLYFEKLKETFYQDLIKIKKPTILEFGVRQGVSTKMFIEVCERNGGKLYSVDIDDYSKKFSSPVWKFIHSRDDNYDYVTEKIPTKFDFIYLDSFHDARHVKKIFYHYYSFLKKEGYFIIDDTSWLLYSKGNIRDHFNSEINNQETFLEILKIFNANMENFDLNFNFKGSGMAKIYKKSENTLEKEKNIISRKYTLKNFIRRIWRNLKN
tara:strand:- start:21627 stop:22268 length:642 start_codon:yes stop_codon:yes gene_type:complete